MSEEGLKKVEDGELFKWDTEGATIQGILLSYKEQATGKGEGHLYEVKTGSGIRAFFAPTVLHKKLSTTPIGNVVKITFTKISKTNSGNDLKNFDVLEGPPTEANLKLVGVEALQKVKDDFEE